MKPWTPRLYEVKNAWCRERVAAGVTDWTEAKRQFERLIDQVRADAYARGKRAGKNGEHSAPHGSFSYQDGPIPPISMTIEELFEKDED